MIPKTFGEIFCGLMKQKLNFLEGLVLLQHSISLKRTP